MPTPIQSLASPTKNFEDDEWRLILAGLMRTLSLKIPDARDVGVGKVKSALPDASDFTFASSVNLSHQTDNGFHFWAVEPLVRTIVQMVLALFLIQ